MRTYRNKLFTTITPLIAIVCVAGCSDDSTEPGSETDAATSDTPASDGRSDRNLSDAGQGDTSPTRDGADDRGTSVDARDASANDASDARTDVGAPDAASDRATSNDAVADGTDAAGDAIGADVAGDGGTVDPCSQIADLCHPFDLGPGAPHDCHHLGESGTTMQCAAELAGCKAACSPGDGGTQLPVTIDFSAVVGAQPFACGTTYTNVGAEHSTITPIDLRVYVTDVRLINQQGVAVPVTLTVDGKWQNQYVSLLDFENGTGGCANGNADTNTVIKGTIPFGQYRGLSFVVGVPEEVNHKDITNVASPLNLSSLYWDWNYGHIFFASVVRADIPLPEGGVDAGASDAADAANADAAPPPTSNEFFMHLGSIDCNGNAIDGGPITCDRPDRPEYTFETFRPSTNKIVIDVAAVLAKSNLATTPMGCHSFNGPDACLWPFEYLGLNYLTGSRTPSTQTTFRMQ